MRFMNILSAVASDEAPWMPPYADGRFARAALFRLSLIEMWERMSYYTLTLLLPLFLSAPMVSGGGGWNTATTLRFYGAYIACITVAPFFGGLISDRWLGSSRALYIGALLMLAGHLALGASASRQGVTPIFYGGLALVAAGNGLFKPNISVLVGRLPHASEAARDAAFGTFWMFINIGSLIATVAGGLVVARLGWHWAFGMAALGMIVAVCLMLAFSTRYITPFATKAERGGGSYADVDWRFLGPIAIVLLVVVTFGIAYFQIFGALSLFTDKHVDRMVLGFEIPTIWLISLNPVFMLVLMPALSRDWRNGRGPGHAWSTTGKFAAAFVLLALAFVVILGAVLSSASGPASPLWIVGAVLLLTCAELLVGPIALAAVSRLSPAPAANVAMGAFSAAIGIGALLSGQVGALTVTLGIFVVFAVIVAGALAMAAVLLACRDWLARRGI